MHTQALIKAARAYLDVQASLDDPASNDRGKAAQERLRQTRGELEDAIESAEHDETLFRRILVAIDGSSASKAALTTAAEMAEEMGSTVAVVHVVDSAAALTAQSFGAPAMSEAELTHVGNELLKSFAMIIPDRVPHVTMLRDGLAADQILAASRSWGADLIVMGSRRLGRLGRILLGSVTETVIHSAIVPVLVVTHEPAVMPPTHLKVGEENTFCMPWC